MQMKSAYMHKRGACDVHRVAYMRKAPSCERGAPVRPAGASLFKREVPMNAIGRLYTKEGRLNGKEFRL